MNADPANALLANWAGNLRYTAAAIVRPSSIDEVIEIVARSPRCRALGTRHSFSDVADTTGTMICLENMRRILNVDRDAMTVTIEAGVQYGALGEALEKHDLALANMASLPDITVAGACATGTHGSGVCNTTLSAAVVALQMVCGDGVVRRFGKADPDFAGMVVSLGALGVVVELTLSAVPAFKVGQRIHERLAFATLIENLDEIMSSAYSVSVFTDWQGDRADQVWLKQRVGDPSPAESPFFGAKAATLQRHPIAKMSAENCTPQLGIAGPAHEHLPHFRTGRTPSSGAELQAEYFIPRDCARQALQAIHRIGPSLRDVLLISEIRTIAADTLWLSPCFERDSLAIHFTWRPDRPSVDQCLHEIEAALKPFAPRPHWAKLFYMSREQLTNAYPKIGDFRSLRTVMDPSGRFQNRFVEAILT